ncbi:unnamed protein product, partial [Meganyctiphanes norvegica]
GLECYTCVYMPGGSTTCLTRPQDITDYDSTVDCKNGDNICCTISRVEDMDKKVLSFNRGCKMDCNPMAEFVETPGDEQTSYRTHCDTPLCNVGPGDEDLSKIDDGDEGDNIINNIPGRTGAAASVGIQYLVIVLCVATLNILNVRY